MGEGRKLAHVADAFGKGHGRGPAAKQGRKALGGFTARVVGVEGEEDAGAAPQGGRGLLHALGAQGGAGGKAPPRNRKPVEEPFGEHRPRRSEAEPPKAQPQASRVPGSGVRGRGSGERETTASSLAGKEESSRKEDNSGQGKDGPAGAIAQGGNGR